MPKRNEHGITVLYEPEPATAAPVNGQAGRAVFDVVAIHGLNGDPIETWKHPTTEAVWLQDLLPLAMPNIRVMTYGYNAKFKNMTGRQDLRTIARKLLAELVDVRGAEEERERPLVLVCHSLGGIVAKQAFLLACDEEQQSIKRCLYAIIFLGTPHRGSDLGGIGKVLAGVACAVSPLRAPRALIGLLTRDSDELLHLNEDFVRRASSVKIVSFFETRVTPILGLLKRMIVEERSAVLDVPNEIKIPQNADHTEIARYSSRQDPLFRPVLSRLRRFEQELVSTPGAGIQATTNNTIQPFGELVPSNPQGFGPSASCLPFDLKTQPCSFFYGRDGILDGMGLFFGKYKSARRTYALCGISGAGKTQTAVQYACEHRPEYKSGIAFLNAASPVSLEADFDRIHDLLRLGQPENKLAAVRAWLCDPQNQEWLLIFDNADDIQALDLARYIPAVAWGHIIITSCNQTVIGDMADDGGVLAALAEEDGLKVIINRAGIENPSDAETRDVKEIGKLLGGLPLGLAHAGAYMRTMRITPGEYCGLYAAASSDSLFRDTVSVGRPEAGVKAWEINYDRVVDQSLDATCLLRLLSFLEPATVPEVLLRRGSGSCRRWGENGEIVEVDAEAEGVDREIITLLQSMQVFNEALGRLLSFSLIGCEKGFDGGRMFSIHPLVRQYVVSRLSLRAAREWRWKALLLVCHAFPRDGYLEPKSRSLGISLMPSVRCVISRYEENRETDGGRCMNVHELASCLLSASRFGSTSWTVSAVDLARVVLKGDDDPFHNAWLAYRDSVVKRISGKLQESEKVLAQSFDDVLLQVDKGLLPTRRQHAQIGNLYISGAENLIMQGKLADAMNMLETWQAVELLPSYQERIVSWTQMITLAKIFRLLGKFDKALGILSGLFSDATGETPLRTSGLYKVLLSEMSGCYCEIGNTIGATQILVDEVTSMERNGSIQSGAGRRLRMALAVTYLQRNMLVEAEQLLLGLEVMFASPQRPSYISQYSTFVIWMLLARKSHIQLNWDEALVRWGKALTALEHLGEGDSSNAGIVRLSMTHALLMATAGDDHRDEGNIQQMVQRAAANINAAQRIYWVPTFNSFWYNYVAKELEGWGF